ncbi:tetratricopeptide repeat-containing diguanylate cyclase [Vibrio sinaloensis]|uniref:tetratricopeptide repeat-containing diguanylate cyclase n=1 Tax=Photobacterium sp. (strain ATCC 43367) TaxID=379097 RepID=UPI00204D5126|nr:tetratricopeptide repeat-containing diguanylate cyclase [Vibrio sinaloensis]UPQ90268.1 diguanylate cyclase [Vibrio sinaloensis]
MKPALLLLLCCCVMVAPDGIAACKLDNDYLASRIRSAEQPQLDLYYASQCRPEQVDRQAFSLDEATSVEGQALYYFALKNLSRYEGVEIPPLPDLVAVGQTAKIDWIEAEAKLNLAITKIDADQLIEGEKLLHEVIPIARDIGYTRLLSRAYRWLGNLKFQQAELKAGLNYYKMAYQLAMEIGDAFQTTMTLNNIANVYMQLQDLPRAEEYIHRAMSLYHDNGFDNSLFKAILYGNSSAIFFANQQYQRAEQYMQMAIDEAAQTGSVTIRVVTLADMAQQHSKIGNGDKALEIAQRCVDIAQSETQSEITLAICEDAMASAFLSQHNYTQAIEYSNKVLDAVTNSTVEELVWEAQILSTLTAAHEQLGEYHTALELTKQQMSVQKKYYDQTHNDEILSEKNSLERQLNRREVELLEAQNELQDIRLQEQRLRETLTVTLFIVFGYFSLRTLMRLKRTNRELMSQNATDTLTGIHNRRYLENWLQQLNDQQANQNYLVCVVDIDHFKQFNDQYGHKAGDLVLTQTALTLQKSIRSQDMLVRWGGEEFVIIVPLNASTQAQETLERLRHQVEASPAKDSNNNTFYITVSLGACRCKKSALKFQWERVFSRADSALYKAKRAGRNRYHIYHD